MKDITLGQYYPVESVIHKLDPRVKIAGTFLFMIAIFHIQTFYGFGIMAFLLMAIIYATKVPPIKLLKGIRGILILLLISVSFNIFWTQGHVLFQLGIIKITEEGLRKAAILGLRLIFLVIGTSIMTLTTTPNDLADGLEKAFHPLNRLHIPVHEFSMMISIALRFIPILMEETNKIMKAQKSRGADFQSGGLIKRLKSLLPLLIPLFVSAVRRAVDLAVAMEARCYRGGEGRTKMKPLLYQKNDYIAYLGYVIFLFLVFIFL